MLAVRFIGIIPTFCGHLVCSGRIVEVKILHRITITADSGIQNQLRGLGIEVEQGFVTFEIDESNVSWPELEPKLSLEPKTT